MAVRAKDAATLMLIRDAPDSGGIEVLMVRRHARSDFAADMHVFPGGEVEESDCGEDVTALCSRFGPDDAHSAIRDAPSPARALGFHVAAVRETFEEAGILLAYESTGEMVSCAGERAARFTSYREELRDNRISFPEMIAGQGLKLALDRLVYFSHWITPELSPIRFDARFFLAPAPPCQDALQDDVEITAHLWISPREALGMSERGEFAMLPPTAANLRVLAGFPTVEDALADSAGKDVPAILPRACIEDGKIRLIMPGDPDYS